MAFNPFKNKNIAQTQEENTNEFPTDDNSSLAYDDLLQYGDDTGAESTIIEEPKFEGEKISDLQSTGIKTEEVVKSPEQPSRYKVQFNLPVLETTPLNSILESFNATKIKDNLYSYNDLRIKTEENRWYNYSKNTGNMNAISLAKHLISIRENLIPEDNKNLLFIAACKHLTELRNSNVINNAPAQVEKVQETIKPIEEAPKTIEKPNYSNTNQQNYEKWKALAEQADAVPLDMVMEFIGANGNEDRHRGKWKVWATGHNVQVSGNTMWNNWNLQVGGHGAISFMIHYLATSNNENENDPDTRKKLRKEAIKQLVAQFGETFEDIANYDFSADIQYKEPFSMPHIIDFKINEVREYLNEKRGLPLWIINKQIAEGLLFAGFPSDWKEDVNLKKPDKLTNDRVWATFLSINGEAAEMRNIRTADQYSKILAKGSNKELGGFLLKAEKDCSEKTVACLEASIDSMSYHSIYPGRIATSCMGVNFNLALSAALETLDRTGWKFQFAFDNDLAGNEAAVHFKKKLLEEITIEEYKEYIKNGDIQYFDLGIRCLKETIAKGDIFYFDVLNNDTGKEAVLMFQEQLSRQIPLPEIKQLITQGKIKYINVCPSFGLVLDPQKEAQNVYNLLNSGKPYYLRMKIEDEEKPDITAKRIAFEEAFKAIAKDELNTMANEGKIIFRKQPLAKDWNEYFLHLKNNPEFRDSLIEQEKHYSHYSSDSDNVKKPRP